MKPADFDSTRKYPLLFHVYGGPGSATVNDAWGCYYLWHLMLTQKGYLVASVDNRGTPAPLGRGVAKGHLRATRRRGDPRPGYSGKDAGPATLCRCGPHRDLGMELRRRS